MDDKLRVGVLGTGIYVMSVHVPVLKMTGLADVVAVCRRDEEKLAMAQEKAGGKEAYTESREMLDKAEMDAVVICTPQNLHCEQTVAALDQGRVGRVRQIIFTGAFYYNWGFNPKVVPQGPQAMGLKFSGLPGAGLHHGCGCQGAQPTPVGHHRAIPDSGG